MDGLEGSLARTHRLKRSCALMFIDLDRFKSINDTLGHQIGDKLLCEVAHRLEDATDDGHRIGRLGGDEFAIVVREADIEHEVTRLAEKIIEVLRSEEHTSELQSLMRISYAVFCFKKKKK